MGSIQKVVIERVEGMIDHPTMQKAAFTGDSAEDQGDAWLREIAKTAPATWGYDKTDVRVTLSNGQEFKYRFDVQHTSLPDNDTSLRQHMRSWFLVNCRPEGLPHIAEPHRLKRAQEMTTPEQKVIAASLLALRCGLNLKTSLERWNVRSQTIRALPTTRSANRPPVRPHGRGLAQG